MDANDANDTKLDFYLHPKVLKKLDGAGREHGKDRSEIIRMSLRKFSRLVRQEKEKTLSDIEALYSKLPEVNKEKISFRYNAPLLTSAMALMPKWDKAELLNRVIVWYLWLNDQARPFRRNIKPFIPPKRVKYTVVPTDEDQV